jgi:glutathione-independent formaldehyde dehydrogenase
MKAVVYDGPRTVSVKEVPDARIERPTDALVRITTTNICGSDLHMYDGRTDLQPDTVLGHENMGEVIGVAKGSTWSRWATWSACRSTSPAAPAPTATTA